MPRKKTVIDQQAEQAVSPESGAMDAALTPDTAASPPGEEMDSNAGEGSAVMDDAATTSAGDTEVGNSPEVTEPPGPDATAAEESFPEDSPPDISQEDAPDDGAGPDLGEEEDSGKGDTDREFEEVLHDWIESGPASDEDSEAPLTLDTAAEDETDVPQAQEPLAEQDTSVKEEESSRPAANASPPRRRRASARSTAEIRDAERDRVLTITARDELQTEEDKRASIWHEIQNADWTRRILTGTLDSVERTATGNTVGVVNYKGFRVVIPLKEMLLYPDPYPTGPEYTELMDRLRRILMTRLYTEIDFVIKGHDNKERCAVGSRKDAMYRKRQTFYLDKNELGESLIYEGRVVQARVVSVAEKMIRVEVFGVECPIVARGLSRSWIGDAGEKYHIGDTILVRVQKITGDTVQNLAVTVDVRSVFQNDEESALKKCVVQGRYAGRVTDVRNGMVFIRLNNGANAIAHACYDRRTPGKRDDVSFSVTRLDPEQDVAVGIITRIIRQNL